MVGKWWRRLLVVDFHTEGWAIPQQEMLLEKKVFLEREKGFEGDCRGGSLDLLSQAEKRRVPTEGPRFPRMRPSLGMYVASALEPLVHGPMGTSRRWLRPRRGPAMIGMVVTVGTAG